MKLKVQEKTAEKLSVTGALRINWNIFGNFFYILEKVAPYNSFSDTPGNILNIDESGIKIINKPDSVITKKLSKNTHVLTSGEMNENITVTTCCKPQVNFCPLFCYPRESMRKRTSVMV